MIRCFYNFWTSIESNLYFLTHYDSKGIELRVFGVVGLRVISGFCGQTLPPAADNVWEKSHKLWLFPLFCLCGQTMLPIVRGQTMLPDFFNTKHVEVSAIAEQAIAICPSVVCQE